MAQIVFTGLNEDEVDLFCQQMKANSATSCESAKQPDGTYSVTVEYPDE
jgi:hypothetical protein